jgi:probable HAF family extracellular repeat protein
LGTLSPGQWFYSVGRGINRHGMVVGYSQVQVPAGVDPYRAFRWTAETGMVELAGLGGPSSRAEDVNDHGQVVGTAQAPEGHSHAVMWDADGTVHDLGTLGGRYSSASAINNRGQVVGVATNASERGRGFIWSERDGMVDLGLPASEFAEPLDINGAGVVVGYWMQGETVQLPFKWTKRSGLTLLDTLGGSSGAAEAINSRGDIVGYAIRDGWFEGMQWTGRSSSPVVLETIDGALQPWPLAINDRGTIVGWAWPQNRDMAAVEWTSPTDVRLLPLDPAGRAYDINDRGQVVGDWNSHAFLLEPSKRHRKRH